jgi:transcriptional regulator with XRE-family HTH domain
MDRITGAPDRGTSDTAPARPRQRLGRELRQLRLVAGLSGQQLGARIGITQTRVSRIETAVYRPPMAAVEAWLEGTEADPETRTRLLLLAREAQTDVGGWRAVFRGSLSARQHQLTRQDATAVRVRQFLPFALPDLLQTPEYARADVRALRPSSPGDVVDAEVTARMARADGIRRRSAPACHVVLTEIGLRWMPGDLTDEERTAAWEALTCFAAPSHITVQVIPVERRVTRAPACGFLLYDYAGDEQSTVDVELPAALLQFADADEVGAFDAAWAHLTEVALGPAESLDFVGHMAEAQRSRAVQ